MNRIRRELDQFRALPRPMRVLLIANMIYGLVLPVIDIFIAAYVMRNTHDVARVISFPLAMYVGTPIAFAFNGIFLRYVNVKHMYALGLTLAGLSVLLTMHAPQLTLFGILRAGFILGLATGLFWANRQFLVLGVTNDSNRNYYYGIELFIGTLAAVIVPFSVGWFISGTIQYGWLGGEANRAYAIIALIVAVLAILSALIIETGDFPSPNIGRYLYWSYPPLWWRMIVLAILKGMAQGYILAMPAMLVLLMVGHEGTLGLIESTGGILTALMLYVVGRSTAPNHRVKVFAIGLTLFAVGSMVNSILFTVTGILVFQLCLVLAKPMLDLAYWPIELGAIEAGSHLSGRDRYAFLYHHEFGLLAGRMVGCGLLIVMAIGISQIAALRYAMPAVALLQTLSIPIALGLERMKRQVWVQKSSTMAAN